MADHRWFYWLRTPHSAPWLFHGFQHGDTGFDSENILFKSFTCVHHSQPLVIDSRWHLYLKLYTVTVNKLLCGTSEAKRHRDHCVCRPSAGLSVRLSSFAFAGATCVPQNTGLINFRPSYVLFSIFTTYLFGKYITEYLSILYDIITNRRWYTQQRLIKSIVM